MEIKYGCAEDDIMHRQARGYSDDEIRAVAAWFAGASGGGGDDGDDD